MGYGFGSKSYGGDPNKEKTSTNKESAKKPPAKKSKGGKKK